MSILPFNITNPGIWIDGILTSAERGFVTNLQGLNYETGDILYANSDGELVLLKAGTNGEFVKLVSGVPAWASAAAAADDTAYDATSWNGNTDAATKNAIRDKIESLSGGHDAVTLAGTGTYLSLSGQVITVDAITESDISDLGTYSTDIHSNATALDAVSGTNTGDEVDMTATVGGLVPTPPNNTTTFLRGDGTFASPPTGGTVDVLSNVATARIIGRTTAGSGDSEELTAAQTRTLLNVADGATANSTNATLLARANHTGTQLAATISNFAVTVRATVLTGLSTASSAAVAAGDTILVAVGKLQAQITNRVSLTGNETITGVKTFSSSPIVPAPTTDLQAATKKYVDDNGGSTFAGARVIRTTNIFIPSTNPYTWNSKDFDTDSYFNSGVSTSKFIIPSGQAGFYMVGVNYVGSNGDVFVIEKNGTIISGSFASSVPGDDYGATSTLVQLAVSDELEVIAASSCTLSADDSPPAFWLYKVG